MLDFVKPFRSGRNLGAARWDAWLERSFTHGGKIGKRQQKRESIVALDWLNQPLHGVLDGLRREVAPGLSSVWN
jgi:hypothetical protein